MEEPANTFDLTTEQQHTALLLDRLLGKAIADRYVDFCRRHDDARSHKDPAHQIYPRS